MKKLWKFIWY